MKRFSAVVLLFLFLMTLLPTTAAAAAYIPRWPEPAWFAQFYNTTPAPQPEKPAQNPPAPTPAPNAYALTAAEQYVLDAINKERTSRGLAALQLDPELVKLARQKSQDFIDNNYFAHSSPVLGSAYDMMRKAGIKYNYAGENLAKTTSAANAVTLFMNSNTHRKTLLNPNFSRTGVGVVQVGRQIYVTQMFIGFAR